MDLLISDLHLSPERPDISRAFFHFLNTRAREADNLYILGDLVEAWIGDDDPDELARAIIAALARLNTQGTRVFFQHGNRDFLIGKRFGRETGAKLLGDYHCIPSPLGNILLCHGDSLCTDDIDYQKFRRRVRNPIVAWLLRHLPLKRRQAIAKRWRAQSRAANSNKPANIMDVNGDAVAAVMAAHQAILLIHGHTHRPGEHSLAPGTKAASKKRIVLGDWDSKGWFVALRDGKASLHSFAFEGCQTGTPE